MEKTVVVITAKRAREIANDWQNNGVLEWVEQAMEKIISASSKGFCDAYIPNPPAYQLDFEKCVDALKSLGYHYCGKNSTSSHWSW